MGIYRYLNKAVWKYICQINLISCFKRYTNFFDFWRIAAWFWDRKLTSIFRICRLNSSVVICTFYINNLSLLVAHAVFKSIILFAKKISLSHSLRCQHFSWHWKAWKCILILDKRSSSTMSVYFKNKLYLFSGFKN